MELADAVRLVKTRLLGGLLPNEPAVSQGAVFTILKYLGWPVLDPAVVVPEYRMRTPQGALRFADYALCRDDGHPLVLIEVKAVGRIANADVQLFEYCFHAGVPFAVLTDGQVWRFYITMEAGSYDERRVYQLDLLEQDDTVCCERLARYLDRESVMRSVNLANARSDFNDAIRSARIQSVLPQAWRAILDAPDNYICEMLAAKVSEICGFEPDLDNCTDFIREHTDILPGFTVAPTLPTASLPEDSPVAPTTEFQDDAPGYIFQGRRYSSGSNTGVMVDLFNKLAEFEPSFPSRFAARKQGYSRRYLAADKYDLYPGQPERCERFSEELEVRGWFLATHQSRATIENSLRLACEVLGLEYGSDVVVNLRSRTPTMPEED